MIQSMTGYGQGRAQNPDFKLNIEMKSVNNRYLDINIRLPRKFNAYEEKIKQAIKDRISRGKVDVYINLEKSEREDLVVRPDMPLLTCYVEAYQQIIEQFKLPDRVDLGKLIRINEALIVEDRELDPETTEATIMEAVRLALDGFTAMRAQEGSKLKLDILAKTDRIKEILGEVAVLAPTLIEQHRDRMRTRVLELLEHVEDFEPERLNMEIAVFADKKAIDEELVRLDSHMEQVGRLLEDDQPVGRKLDFLLQEINREVNTIGSKSPDYDISTYVIELKSELEKIREQIQNIE